MAKIQLKSEKVTPFGGIFHVRELFSRYMDPIIDKVLGLFLNGDHGDRRLNETIEWITFQTPVSIIFRFTEKDTNLKRFLSLFFLLTGLKTRAKFSKREMGRKYASFEGSGLFLELSEYQEVERMLIFF